MPGAKWLELLLQHVPDRGEHLVRYYGWYSNRARGMRRNSGAKAQPTFIEGIPERDNRGQCGLAMPRTLAGVNPARVIASHEPGIEPCSRVGNDAADA